MLRSELFMSKLSKAKIVLNSNKQKLKTYIHRRVVDRIDHAEFAGMLWLWDRGPRKEVQNIRCCCQICGIWLDKVSDDSCHFCESMLDEPELIARFIEDQSQVKTFIENQLSLMRAGKKRVRISFQKEFLYQKYNQLTSNLANTQKS